MHNAAASKPTPRPSHYQAPKPFTQPPHAANPVTKQAPPTVRDKQTVSSSSKQSPSTQVLPSLPPSAPTRSSASIPTAPAVLPSPAPSDEPSPAVSATPYEAPSPSNSTTANPFPTTTEARFEVVPAGAGVVNAIQPPSGNAPPNGSIPPPSGEVRPMSASTTSPALPPASAGSSLQTPPTPSITTFNRATAPSEPGRDQEQPAKRRRMVSGLTLLQALKALPVLDAQIRQSGGVEALEPGVERPRYQLLRDACEDGDIFFVVLHQIFCLWSSSPRETHKLYIQGIHDPALIDSAFGQMSTILKSNSLIRSEQLSWLVQFPGPLDVLRNAFPEYSRVVRAVLDFLVRLTQFWMVVNNEHRKLGYPLLVDEMLSTFQLYSTVLQTIVFRASRRTCGITDGPVGAQMDKLFKEDQIQHRQPNGSFMVRTDRDFHKEPINQIIIQKYQALAARMQMSNNAAYMPYNNSPDLRQQAFQQQQRLNNSSPLQLGPQTTHGSFSRPPTVPSSTSAGPSPVIATAHLGSPGTPGGAASPTEQQNQPSFTTIPAHYQLPSQMESLQSVPSNGQHIPANHSPSIAQGHFNQPQQLPGFQQQPMPMPMYQQQNLGMRRSSYNHGQISNGRSPHLQNVACLPSQAQNSHFSAMNGQVMASQDRQNHSNQSGGQTSPNLQNIMQAPVPSPQRNMAMPVPMEPTTRNMPRNIAPAVASNPSGNEGQLPQYVQQHMQHHFSLQQQQMHVHRQMQTQALQQHLRQQQQQGGPQPVAVNAVSQQGPVRSPSVRGNAQLQGDPSRVNPRNQTSRDVRIPPIHLQDYPHDPYDRKSVSNALHQADIRSPKRMLSGAFKFTNNERYYQYIKSLALDPSAIPPHNHLYSFLFNVSNEEYARISRDTVRPGDIPQTLPVNVFSNGSIRLRLRRKQHYAQDQPIEIGGYVSPGLNELKISVPPNIPQQRVWPSNKKPFIAVEVVETLSHSSVLALHNLSVDSSTPAEQTVGIIRKRLGGPSGGTDDDDIAIIASDLTIRVADPFSLCIFNTPVRGANCDHLECFDLETWLNTRPSKKSCVCGSREANCRICPREPTFTDKWKCPICGEDARPQSLRIDGFLSDVRAALAAQGRLGTKDIAVSADGTWKPVVESEDEDGDDDSDVDTTPAVARSARSRSISKPMLQRAPVEVITLDDD
ncbi:miz zinc finger protein [Apiospora hydei]|uniref:Miz zinc finger protein n=1 Tax=Apiospora hydei TaxID=1337664 RepID=A0ABR1WRJ7_9PEZI